MSFIVFLLVVMAFILLGWLNLALWRRYYHVPRHPDEIHFVTTSDGWHLALHRYRPMEISVEEPVFMCHGLGANRYNFDLDDRHSLAKYLKNKGFDAWIVELRGCGMSERPGLFRKHRWGWTFDDHAKLDIPAAVKAVLDLSGQKRLNWIGHSMGGILAYVFLQTGGADSIRSVVAVASGVEFNQPELMTWVRLLKATGFRPAQFSAGFTQTFTPLLGIVKTPLSRLLLNPDNMDARTIRRAVINLMENTSRGVAAQFSEWLFENEFYDLAWRVNYREGLSGVRTPMLFMAGSADLLSPASSVHEAYRRLGTKQKAFIELGRLQGQKEDYGHGDLLVGRHVETEVFPLITDWLDKHSTKKQPEQRNMTERRKAQERRTPKRVGSSRRKRVRRSPKPEAAPEKPAVEAAAAGKGPATRHPKPEAALKQKAPPEK